MIYGAEDVLTLTISAMRYYTSEGAALPAAVTVVWFIDGHPCDGLPHLAGVSFDAALYEGGDLDA